MSITGPVASGVLAGGISLVLALALISPSGGEQQPAGSPATRVTIIGDSLTVGTLIYGEPSYLRLALSHTPFRLRPRPSAKVGRSVAEGLAILADIDGLPDVVVIELGANNWSAGSAAAARWIARARRIVGPGRTLFWINLRMAGQRFAAHRTINRGLVRGVAADNAAAVKAGRAGRSYVLDWNRFSRRNGIAPGGDGIHYGPSGYQSLARFVAGSLAQHPRYRAFRIPRLAPAPTPSASPSPTPTPTPPPLPAAR